MEEYVLKAYAKINLGLDVTGKLQNGYHLVKMIMQTVGIHDELSLKRGGTSITVTTDSDELPMDENNLIYKAAARMRDAYSLREGLRIHLKKNIPIAAGMAGGSTDAAATIKGINQLFRLGLSPEEMREIALPIGADVPYCIQGGTVLAEGIGEKLTALPPAPACHLLVAKPDINVSTKFVYEHLDAAESLSHPDIDGMAAAIREGSLQGIIDRLGNVLESVTVPAHPVIRDIKEKMLQTGAAGSLMSGSGPTVFGIYTDKSTAENAYAQLAAEKSAKQLFLTGFVGAEQCR